MRRIVIPSILVGLFVLAACSEQSPTPESAPAPSEATTEPSPVTSPDLPKDEARLEGDYKVKLFVRRSNFLSNPAKLQNWSIEPTCDKGTKCPVVLSGKVEFGSGPGSSKRAPSGAKNEFDVKLHGLGGRYGGSVTDFFASCGDAPCKDTWTFSMRVTEADYVGDTWIATEWEGSWSRFSPGNGVYRDSRLTAVVRGSLEK
jgi:hypothetical protein